MLSRRATISCLIEMLVTFRKPVSEWKVLVSVLRAVSINISPRPPKLITSAYTKFSEDRIMVIISVTKQIPGGNSTFRSPEMGAAEMTQGLRMFAPQV